MPSLSSHPATNLIKGLAVGDSGTAKTGSLASLALAGYKLKIADFDNGLDVLYRLLEPHPEALARVDYQTFTNEYEKAGQASGRLKPKKADAFKRSLAWIEEAINSSGPDTWLVIDSFTRFCDRCMDRALELSGHLGQQPTLPDYGNAMADIESFLQLLNEGGVECNYLLLAHKTYVEGDNGVATPYPRAIGTKLPPKVPTYFNTMIGFRASGSGESVKREIMTTPYQGLGFKTPNPGKVKASYPLDFRKPESGLIDFVRDIGVTPP